MYNFLVMNLFYIPECLFIFWYVLYSCVNSAFCYKYILFFINIIWYAQFDVLF